MAVVNSSKFTLKEAADWGLSRFVSDVGKEYCYDILQAMDEAVPSVAKEAARRLRQTSPREPKSKDGGRYAKGWTYKKSSMFQSRTVGAVVYGKSGTYQLAHLLENGHAKRGGGRTKAIAHIKPVEEWAVDEAINRTLDLIGKMY